MTSANALTIDGGRAGGEFEALVAAFTREYHQAASIESFGTGVDTRVKDEEGWRGLARADVVLTL